MIPSHSAGNGTDTTLTADRRLAAASERLLQHGLPALLIGAALLIAMMWWFTLHLAGLLATTHVEQKMADVGEKARAVLQEAGDARQAGAALAWLARFRDVRRLELRDDAGRVVWRNAHGVSQVRRALPPVDGTVLEQRDIDGMPRVLARHHAVMTVDGQRLHLLMEADVSALLARYREVAVVVAKVLTTVVLLAVFLMGWMLIWRWREQRALAVQIEELLRQGDSSGEGLRGVLERMSEENSALLRRMLALAGGSSRTAPERSAGSAAEGEKQRRHA